MFTNNLYKDLRNIAYFAVNISPNIQYFIIYSGSEKPATFLNVKINNLIWSDYNFQILKSLPHSLQLICIYINV